MRGSVEHFLQYLFSLQDTLQDLGWAGVLAYALFVALFQMTLMPLSPVAISGGLIFGLSRGFVGVTIGTALGAAINFLIARYAARKPLERRLSQNHRFRAIDHAIGREGWRIVALLRLCPIPFGFANFCYGLTAVAFWPYLIATAFAIIPGNFMFTYIGATAQEGLEALMGTGRARHPGEYALMVVGLLATCAAVAYVGKVARTALAHKPEAQGEFV